MSSRDKQLLDFIQSAKSAIQLGVSRKAFSAPIPGGEFGEVWERKTRGLAYDVAKGMKNSDQDSLAVDLVTGEALKKGAGATMYVGSDRYPYSLVGWASNSRTLYITQDKFTRTDKNGQSETQEYKFEPNPNAVPEKATWSPTRRKYTCNGAILSLGTRRAYQDPGF